MKPIVTREVSAVALRPIVEGKLAHGRYYGIITLNQLLLARGETEVANKLIDVYFSIFADLLTRDQAKHAAARASKKGGKPQQDTQHDVEVDSKLLAAVLTGVNRAFPYAALDEAVLKERLDTLYRITHHGAFNVSLQALSLVYRLSMSSTAAGVPSDRFYRTLYDSLIDPRLAYASKHPMYLNLVFKSARADPSHNRQAAFVKRLLQSLAYHQPAYTCGALRLVSELFAVNPALKAMLSDAEEADEEHFADVPEEADEAATSEGEEEEAVTRRYDPRKREPQYAGAEKTCLWEIVRHGRLSYFPHPAHTMHSALFCVTIIPRSASLPNSCSPAPLRPTKPTWKSTPSPPSSIASSTAKPSLHRPRATFSLVPPRSSNIDRSTRSILRVPRRKVYPSTRCAHLSLLSVRGSVADAR